MDKRFNIKQLVVLGKGLHISQSIRNGQYLAATAILRRLYGKLALPGTILADEVGMGKTYVALGVAAWCLKNVPKSRVLILTTSKPMADEWKRRWDKQISYKDGSDLPECVKVNGLSDFETHKNRRVLVGSYDTLKRHATDPGKHRYPRVKLVKWLFEICQPRHVRFPPREKNKLKKALLLKEETGIDLNWLRGRRLDRQALRSLPSRRMGLSFWRNHFDSEKREWRDTALQALTEMVVASCLRTQKFDLLIVDEAHRLESPLRQDALRMLFDGRATKRLYVTATPFALAINQLLELIRSLRSSAAEKDDVDVRLAGRLTDFERQVDHPSPNFNTEQVEQELRKWIVRRRWDAVAKSAKRMSDPLPVSPDLESEFIPTLALERTIVEMLKGGKEANSGRRTHIASRRASLCSSWAAARRSLHSLEDKLRDSGLDDAIFWAGMTSKCLPPRGESEKIQKAADRIVDIVLKKKTKIVVFAEREETLTRMRDELSRRLHIAEDQTRKRNNRWGRRLRDRDTDTKKIIPILASQVGIANDNIDSRRLFRLIEAWKRQEKRKREGVRLGWIKGMKRKHVLKAVAVYDGKRGDEDTLHSFNLPGMPWVLLCSAKAQESIDLHWECNTVMLLDPVWNPAHREQRIGRVHRAGSRFKRVNVIDVYTKGTYEHLIYRRSMKRAKMMALLLGAGKWLDQDIELDEETVEKCRIDLQPRANAKKDLVTSMNPPA